MERVIVENLSKKFTLGFQRTDDFSSRIAAWFRRASVRELPVLQQVTFTANAGETLGVVGRNGAGKSTLLGIIAGIYEKDGGMLIVKGKVLSVTGLVHALKDYLTMRENIYLCAALYGMNQRVIRVREDTIVNFSELQSYVDTKLYKFSTGMIGRLIFSVAVNCDPEILLFDEVTSNFDNAFVLKAQGKIKELSGAGVATLIVSHQQSIIQECDRVLWLEKGKVVMEDSAHKVIKKYWK